jgi:hypothetical protein
MSLVLSSIQKLEYQKCFLKCKINEKVIAKDLENLVLRVAKYLEYLLIV